MLFKSAEKSYAEGLHALNNGESRKAMALFEAAIEIERRLGATEPQARYLSFYGLCLALEENRLQEGVRLCRQAREREFYNADLCWNLARVLLKAGRRREAHSNLVSGRRLQPGHPGILRELKTMGRRRRPVLPFLSRRNPINVFLGRLTWSEPKSRGELTRAAG